MSVLQKIWEKITAKMGRFATFLPMVINQIALDISEGKKESAKARNQELREAFQAGLSLCNKVDAAIDDNSITATETADMALGLEKFVDELEDVFKGYDENDLNTGSTTGDGATGVDTPE